MAFGNADVHFQLFARFIPFVKNYFAVDVSHAFAITYLVAKLACSSNALKGLYIELNGTTMPTVTRKSDNKGAAFGIHSQALGQQML